MEETLSGAMMSSLAATTELAMTPCAEGVTLLGLPTERTAKRRLSNSADDIIKTIASVLDAIIEDVIQKRTAVEFQMAADEAFPQYISLVLSVDRIIGTLVPRATISRLSSESFSELEADIRQDGVACFGPQMHDRAVFTVWTLRKISDLLEVLAKSKNDAAHAQQENELAKNFLLHALRSRFHVDCLTTAMRTHRALYPEVLPLIDDGLRSAVDAYAWVKQAVDLRFPTDESTEIQTLWTDEEQRLVDSSMHDLDKEDVE